MLLDLTGFLGFEKLEPSSTTGIPCSVEAAPSSLMHVHLRLRRQKDARDAGTGSRESYVSRWSQTCLFLDCAMICYVILVGLVDMAPWRA